MSTSALPRPPAFGWWHFLLIALALNLTAARKRRVRRGTLIVQSLTMDAEIFVDGERVATVPMADPVRLEEGQHTIKVSKPGHADYIDTFRVRRRKRTTLEIDLLAVAGVLHVDSTPVGAAVVVDGRQLGATPYTGELPPGERVVELRLPGHTVYKRRFAVTAGEIYPLAADLVPVPEPLAEAVETPWYGRWWIWAGAAVIAGGVTAAVLLGGDEGAPADPPFLLEIEPIR